MRTTTAIALVAATTATTALAKDAGGFQLLYTSSANVSWCIQPRAEDDKGNPRPPQVGDQLIFDDCHYAVEGLKRGQIWSWLGNQLQVQLGGSSSFCLGLGERVVLASCSQVEDGQGEDGDDQGQNEGDNEAAGAMAPKTTVAASLINWKALTVAPGSHATAAADPSKTAGTAGEGGKKEEVKTKWLFPFDGKLCVSKDECISAQHPQDAPTSITPALTITDRDYAAHIGFARTYNPHGVDAASQAGAGRVGGEGVQNQSGSAQGHKVPPSDNGEEQNTDSHNGLGRFGRIGLPAKVWQDDGGKNDETKESE
ncbi:hypothetical protein A1Q2_05583 [Trichosporon asahii var. asahii CBS 8904]|uniref:Uncharacterized protein n=1 Tax=Trichosporon asahii var. asahii (strain CBS 8904) TaxID=1220162 RepID=K1V827_TRIAC|nr:hypothetical protein A1Q2_05583 [Trichosporon asahii var. asahii CBS 8904]